MKLILCGKGGCGKSTLATLLARSYAEEGKQVLVVDSDESNFGLHRQLGLDLPEDFTHYFGHKKGIYEDGAADVFEGGWHLSDIPEEYSSKEGNIRLMAIGKIHDAGEGCACAMGSLNRIFLEHLVLEENDVCIVDTEAGVEHFGRCIDRYADAILMVADPSYESIMLTEKISGMAEDFGKPVFIVLNKVDADQEAMMRETIGNSDKIIAALPADKGILAAGLKGEALTAELPAIETIKKALAK